MSVDGNESLKFHSNVFRRIEHLRLSQIAPTSLADISAKWFPLKRAGSSRGFTVNSTASPTGSSPSKTSPIVTSPPKQSTAKKSGNKVAKSLHIPLNCLATVEACWTTFYGIRSSHNPGFADA
jgi:hypothetical protein